MPVWRLRDYHEGQPAGTEDYLAAIADTRPTLTPDILSEFEQDHERYTRP